MNSINKIRNFSIIAHIDHGKSTLADRMIEVTNTVDSRQMQEQILDDMELERERGITIKMRPVRMTYCSNLEKYKNEDYILNLIDTPGHIDFSYEVSRALKAVEGSILLVDSTQGVQAQTLTTLEMARELGLVIIPVLSKVDSPRARIDDVSDEIISLIGCKKEDIMLTSGKTGEGVPELLDEIIKKIPEPKTTNVTEKGQDRAMIFDFQYSNHRGIILYTRVFDGEFKAGDELKFSVADRRFLSAEVGTFRPKEQKESSLSAGEIGYVVTGIKEPGVASVGDTITKFKNPAEQMPGYSEPKPVVWASVFPESQDDFDELRSALGRLKLSDSSLAYEEESSGSLGRGFRCGFLGMLHLEIITERLRREFNLDLVVTLPSINYVVTTKKGEVVKAYSAAAFPEYGDIETVEEPWIEAKIITPNEYLGQVMQLLYSHEAMVGKTENLSGDRASLTADMPLRELMRNFFDELKSVSSGYASLSYQIGDFLPADVVKMEILVAEEEVPAFSRIIARNRIELESEQAVEKLYEALPRQMFTTKIQAKALGRIISSKTLSALRKNVTAHLYGGDITRKMKLREKQKKGKKKMQAAGKVRIGQDVFLKMMKNGD
jgi:GTP-binding protein LepA